MILLECRWNGQKVTKIDLSDDIGKPSTHNPNNSNFQSLSDDEQCQALVILFASVFPELEIIGGADEPFYQAPVYRSSYQSSFSQDKTLANELTGTEKLQSKAKLFFRANYPRSLLHELSHYCLAGKARRQLDDFGYWYTPCGRDEAQQRAFEQVEARPQGLEKALCEAIGIAFSPSLDDFSGNPASAEFIEELEAHYQQMLTAPPPSARRALEALRHYRQNVQLQNSRT